MSIPQNNLDDLRRKAQTAVSSGQSSQPREQSSKGFKFKSTAAPSRPIAISSSKSPSTISQLSPPVKNNLSVQPIVHQANSVSCHRSVSTAPITPETDTQDTSKDSIYVPSSCSPLNIPSKRLSSTEEITSSGGSSKRPKTLHSKDISELSDTMDFDWDIADEIRHEQETRTKNGISPLCQAPPQSSTAHPFSDSSADTSPDLLTDYERHTVEDLQLMLTNNMSARLDTMDKLLRAVNRQEAGVDCAMLQDISNILERRIAAIKVIIEARRSGVPLCSTTHATCKPSSTPRDQASAKLPSIHAHAHANVPAASISTRSTIPQSPITHATDQINPIMTQHTSKSNDASTGITSIDDEEELWAQFDDVPSDDLDVGTNSPHPLRSIGNTLEARCSPSTRETFRPAESAAKTTSLPDLTQSPYYPEIMDRLRNVFRLDSFRHNQFEAINAALSGKDVFVLMPTGGGKSLCYQVPAVCEGGTTRGVTVVVSPLISLMIDQVHHLQNRGIDAVLFNSDQDQDSSRDARSRLTRTGRKPKLLYVTPEKLHQSNDMRFILTKLYQDGELARFVIDEAHCVSTWGRDFREAYQNLDHLRREYPKTPIMALTATANEQVRNDVIDRLGIRNCVLLTQSFNRPNLHYEIRSKRKNVLADINAFIQSNHRGQTGIIYCSGRNKCEEVAKELRDKYGLKAKHYHAQMPANDKSKAQLAWQNNECDIIVATIAFGMGIDKPDVRYVIHYSLPMSMDGYYQETGRAGRDGKPATCVLFYTYSDTNILFRLIQDNEKATYEEKKRQEDGVRMVVQYCQNVIDCRRVQLLSHFAEVFDSKECKKRCDNCLDGAGCTEEDMTNMAVQAIRLVKDLLNQENNVSKLHCIDVFRGANTKVIRDKGHNNFKHFGAGSSLAREQCERLFDHLLSLEGFRQVSVPNKAGWNNLYLQLGDAANEFLTGKRALKMAIKIAKPDPVRDGNVNPAKLTKATTRRKKGIVPSMNKSQDDVFNDEDSEKTVDMDDIYDFGSSPLRPVAPTIANNSSASRKPKLKVIQETNDTVQQCYEELSALYDEQRNHVSEFEDLDYDGIFQIISAILPTDQASLKEVLHDNLSQAQAEAFCNKYGRRVLGICTKHKMSLSTATPGNTRSSKFDKKDLHAQFDFQRPASKATKSVSVGQQKTVARGKPATKAPLGRGIQAMPL